MSASWYDWVSTNLSRLIAWLRVDNSRLDALEKEIRKMSDVLDTLKSDFEAYQQKVNDTLVALNQKISDLTAGQLDPAKAQAIDDEVKAAIAALAPPSPPQS